MFNRNPKFVRDLTLFIILLQFIIGIGVAAYQFAELPIDIDDEERMASDELIFDPNTQDYVDVNTSDVDGEGSQGSHSNFPEMQATNDIYDTLTENEANTPPLEYFVNYNESDVDSSSNLGTHSNFTTEMYYDAIYDNITEKNIATTDLPIVESSSTASSSGNTFFINCNKPSGTVEGDLIVAVFSKDSNQGSLSSPSGWTDLAEGSTSESRYLFSYKVAGASEPTQYTFTSNDEDQMAIGIVRISGVDTSDPINAQSSTNIGFGQYPQCLAATTTKDNCLILRLMGADDDDVLAGFNYPSGHTGIFTAQSTGQFGETHCAAAYVEKTTAGDTGPASFIMTESEQWDAMTVTINPASVTPNYQLSLETQFTEVPYFLATETLCIYAGSFNTSEDIGVYEWDGSQWQFLGNLTASSWNYFTVSYLTSINYTIKFKGWNETSDSELSSWQIDATLLRLEGAGQNETVVDNDTSDVDSSEDVGILTDFNNMTAMDSNVASLSETVNYGSLDCTGGYMIIGDGSVDWSSTAGTISFWIKFDTVSGRPYGQDTDMELRFSGSNIVLDWGSDYTMTTATSFSAGTWYFIAVVWDETFNNLLVYIGDETATPTLDANSKQGTWFSSLPFFDETNYFMRGIMSGGEPIDGHGQDLRYYNIARSQASIQNDYKQQLTGSESNLVNYYKLFENFEDSAGNDDGMGSGSYSFVTNDYAPLTYQVSDMLLDQEVQWTDLLYQLPNEELCIYCGTLGDEDILVDVWNGTGWENLFSDLTANSWNNVSIAGYLTNSTFTIRFRDGNTTGDTTIHDSWDIDATLIHVWQEATVYKLDLEIQWTSADFDEYYEELCIKTGTIEAEDISVDVWDGSQWQEVISDLNPAAWNNVSVTSYLTSATFTIRFRGGTESSDINQESWQIDAVLLHTWTPFDDEPPNISWGSNQFANDTGTHQVNIDIDAEDIYYGADIDKVWYRIWNVSAAMWVPGHNNESLSPPEYVTVINISTWHPSFEYYVEAFANDTIVPFGNENTTQNITGDEYRYFTIVHSIDVSQPTVSYSGGSIKEIDITDVTATCSYAAHGVLEGYSEAIAHNFTIYTNEGSPTGITGELVWTGSFWQAFDVDVSSLSDGTYYVTCTFEDSDATGTSSASNTFTITSGGGGNGGSDGNDGGGNDGIGGREKELQVMILSLEYPSQIEKYSDAQIEMILTDGEGTLVSEVEVTVTIDNGTEPLYIVVDEKEGYYTALLVTDTIERGNHTIIISAKKAGFETYLSSAFSFEIIVFYPLFTLITHPSYAPQVIENPIQLLIDPTFYILISLILVSVMLQQTTFTSISSKKLRALYIFTSDGKCFYYRTFTIGGVESQLMTAALSGTIKLIMEATSSEMPTRTVDQGNFNIVLEYGRSFIIATFVEKRTINKRRIRKCQKELVERIEEKYGPILINWDGNLNHFQEMNHLVLDAFDFKVTKDLVRWINDAAKTHEEFVDYYANLGQYQMAGSSIWKAYDLYVKIQSPKASNLLARWIALEKGIILNSIQQKTELRTKIISLLFALLDFVRTPVLLKTLYQIRSLLNLKNSN